MRSYVAFALACIFFAGCSGGSSSTTSPLAPSAPSGSTNGSGNAGAGASERILSSRGDFIAWYNELPLSFLNDLSYSCSTASNISIAFTPDFNHVYVAATSTATISNNSIFVFDGANYSQDKSIDLGGAVSAMAATVTPDNTKLYVAVQPITVPPGALPPDSLDVIDITSGKIIKTITFPTSSQAQWMTTDHAGTHVYLYSDDANRDGTGRATLTRINVADDSIAYKAQFPSALQIRDGLRISRDDTTFNMFSTNDDNVYSVDAASGSKLATYKLPDNFAGLDESKTASEVYVLTSGADGNKILTFDSRTVSLKNSATILPGALMFSVAAGSSGRAYVDFESSSGPIAIDALDPKSGNVLDSISKPSHISATNLYAQ